MALVAYDNSDTSEYEDDENEGQSTGLLKESSVTIEATKVTAVARDNDSNSEEPQTLFNELPLPSSKKKTVIEEDDEFLHKKEADPEIKSKSKITIPSLSDFKDVEKTVPNTKAKTLNGKKSGLLSMLPQPKNAVKSSIKSLIPNSVAQKPPQPKTLPVQKMKQTLSPTKINKVNTSPTIVTEYSDESDDDVQNDFFSINKPVDISEDIPLDIENKTEKVENTKSQPRSLESYFKKDINVEQECHIQPQVSDYSDSVQNIDNTEKQTSDVLDEEAILKLVGARGKRKREEIQIVDVNQQEVLNDAREWLLKGLMDDTTKRQSVSKKRGNEPTNQQKRKHQITYLAHQAKANEAELQNQWANNRMTKRQTQSKYGF